MSDSNSSRPGSVPNIYFIDDSATMREVVKIAFRHENFNVVTCSDVTSAIDLFAQTVPDAVVSDVIMPDKDGYELCQFVKQHPELRNKPVILMSGMVNQEVAERAHEVKADELLRKPFHPQDLVARVKKLLSQNTVTERPAPVEAVPVNPLSQLFGFPMPAPSTVPATQKHAISPSASPAAPRASAAAAAPGPAGSSAEVAKLRSEIRHLGTLVKKLQAQLEVEREYCAALESQLRTLSTAE
jgi:CheY-like chemotaxis protein